MDFQRGIPVEHKLEIYNMPHTGPTKHTPHTSSSTLPSQHPAKPFHSNTNKPKLHESCSTKSKPYSKLQIKPFVVVLLKKSFVIHLCCLKNIVFGKITISRNRNKLDDIYLYIYIYIYTSIRRLQTYF